MACSVFSDINNITATLDCCTLTLVDTTTSEVCFNFDLNTTISFNKGGNTIIRDDKTYLTLSNADLATLGLTTLGIIAAADACRCASGGGGGAPTTDYEINSITCIDDVNGDGSVLNEFIQIIRIDTDTGAVNLLGTFETDSVTPYTVQGTIVSPDSIGDIADIKQERLELNGAGTWSPGALVRSYSYFVLTIGDTNNPPTFTSSSGLTTSFRASESGTYSLDNEADLMNTDSVIETFAGDTIIINYTTL